jgi:hypothetical protein
MASRKIATHGFAATAGRAATLRKSEHPFGAATRRVPGRRASGSVSPPARPHRGKRHRRRFRLDVRCASRPSCEDVNRIGRPGRGCGRCCTRLRPARHHQRARPARPGPSRPGRQAAPRGRPPRDRPRRRPRVHRLPHGGLAPDLVEQPARAAQPGDPPAHRRGRHLPRPRRPHPLPPPPALTAETTEEATAQTTIPALNA